MLMQKVCFDDAELDLPFCMSLLLWGRTFPQRFLGQTEQSGDRKARQKREGGRNKERCLRYSNRSMFTLHTMTFTFSG